MRSQTNPGQLLQAVLATVEVPAQGRVLIAVSGGPDSIALLYTVLAAVRSGARDWEVGAAHVNHTLRGSQADDDERFVRGVAEGERLPFWSTRVDTRAHARTRHLPLEVAARELRYRALFDVLEHWSAEALLTGHTQDDQAETVLLRLLRGSGLRGLGGMRARAGPLVRPFLGVRREEVITFLQAEGLGYRVDSSNADPRHTRNRVRRDLLPTLDLFQPRLVPVLARTAESLQHDADFVFGQAEEALTLMDVRTGEGEVSASRTVWRSLHAALRRATLLLLLERLERQSPELSHDHLTSLEGAIDAGHGPLQPLPHGTSLEETADRFTLRTSVPTRPAPLPDTTLHVPGDTEMGSGWIKAEILERAEELSALLAVRGPLHALCDADAIQGRLVVGARRPGDRMTLLGSPGSRKVQDIMVDRKVPGQERDRVPVIRDESGIVWIAGVALAARTAIRQDTRRILHLTCQPDSLNT